MTSKKLQELREKFEKFFEALEVGGCITLEQAVEIFGEYRPTEMIIWGVGRLGFLKFRRSLGYTIWCLPDGDVLNVTKSITLPDGRIIHVSSQRICRIVKELANCRFTHLRTIRTKTVMKVLGIEPDRSTGHLHSWISVVIDACLEHLGVDYEKNKGKYKIRCKGR